MFWSPTFFILVAFNLCNLTGLFFIFSHVKPAAWPCCENDVSFYKVTCIWSSSILLKEWFYCINCCSVVCSSLLAIVCTFVYVCLSWHIIDVRFPFILLILLHIHSLDPPTPPANRASNFKTITDHVSQVSICWETLRVRGDMSLDQMINVYTFICHFWVSPLITIWTTLFLHLYEIPYFYMLSSAANVLGTEV